MSTSTNYRVSIKLPNGKRTSTTINGAMAWRLFNIKKDDSHRELLNQELTILDFWSLRDTLITSVLQKWVYEHLNSNPFMYKKSDIELYLLDYLIDYKEI